MMHMVEIKPDHPCDKCGHPSKYHADVSRRDFLRLGSRCMVVGTTVWHGERIPKPLKAKQCLCNQYEPKP